MMSHFLHENITEITTWPWKWGEFGEFGIGGHNWSSKGPKALTNGWLVERACLTTWKPAGKRRFVGLKIAPIKNMVEIWRQVLSFRRFVEKSSSVLKIIFRCFSWGSSCKQHQGNHADNTNETVIFFIAVTSTFQTSARAWT